MLFSVSLFTYIQFQNKECTVGTSNGVCFTPSECTENGGTNIGSCAFGYGVCCYCKLLYM